VRGEKGIAKNSSYIYRALLKFGYSNFSLEILEYCDPSYTIGREQYYMDLFKPEYNILKIAGS
jgi:group I intron endonuclease